MYLFMQEASEANDLPVRADAGPTEELATGQNNSFGKRRKEVDNDHGIEKRTTQIFTTLSSS